MIEERYYKDEKGHIHQFGIDYDYEPFNPRTEDEGNIGHMHLWWNNYDLGDKDKGSNAEDSINELVRKNISDKTLINYIRNKKTSNNLEIVYDRKEKEYTLCADYIAWCNKEIHHGEVASNNNLNYLIDDIIEAMTVSDKVYLLEKKGFYFMNCFIYEHSGLTISCARGSASSYPYNDRWDSGCAGYIYTTKKDILSTRGSFINKKTNKCNKVSKNNWKVAAKQWLEGEVEMYDMYLVGDVYEIIDIDTTTDEEYRCGGYYSRTYGSKLFNELAYEHGIDDSMWVKTIA